MTLRMNSNRLVSSSEAANAGEAYPIPAASPAANSLPAEKIESSSEHQISAVVPSVHPTHIVTEHPDVANRPGQVLSSRPAPVPPSFNSPERAPHGERDLQSYCRVRGQRRGGSDNNGCKTDGLEVRAVPRTSHLNLKFTVADTDAIKRMAESGKTAYGIALWFTRQWKPVGTDEIIRICADMGVVLRKTNKGGGA